MSDTKTYVIQDWFGLFHIFQSQGDFKSVYVWWLTNNDYFIGTQYAISTEDLREKLMSMGVETIEYYSVHDYNFQRK